MAYPEYLKSLHTELVDTRRGYEEAARDAASVPMRALFRQMLELRTQAEQELHPALETAGEKVDDDGSLMSVVHRTVIGVRAALSGGLDTSALPAFVSGEQRVLSAYQDAIDECRSHPEILAVLEAQKAALLPMIARMNDLIAASTAKL